MFESRLLKLTVGRCESDRTLGLAVAQVPEHSATDNGGQIHPFGETLARLFIGQDIGRQRQITLDEDVAQTVLTQGADQTIESHGREMADGRTPFQTEPAMSGQQGISGRLGSHRAVPQDAMGQHGKHGLTIRALNAPDGETTQPDTGIVGVAGQAPALAAAGLVEELKAEREEKRAHELDKRLGVTEELKVRRLVLKIDGDGPVLACRLGGVSHVLIPRLDAIGAEEDMVRVTH